LPAKLEEAEEKPTVSANQLNLNEHHHLLKAIIMKNQNAAITSQSCVGNAFYDI
jgi:hypothetical protein